MKICFQLKLSLINTNFVWTEYSILLNGHIRLRWIVVNNLNWQSNITTTLQKSISIHCKHITLYKLRGVQQNSSLCSVSISVYIYSENLKLWVRLSIFRAFSIVSKHDVWFFILLRPSYCLYMWIYLYKSNIGPFHTQRCRQHYYFCDFAIA